MAAVTIGPFTVGEEIEPVTLPAAVGGDEPLRYSVRGQPDGLVFDADTRALRGTPTSAGESVLVYRAEDADGDPVVLEFLVDVVEPQPPEPDPIVVSLHVDRPDEPEASATLRQTSSGDDAGEGGIHSTVSTVQEGESFRLMVRFTGTVPVAGTCTITLADSGGHDMADATATANGFDASTDLIATVDDDPVTTDRIITATLATCDLGDVAYTIGETNSVTISVRDHDPETGTQTVPGGVPVGVAPPDPDPDDEEPAWVRGSYTATMGSLSAVWETYEWHGRTYTTVSISGAVNVSPSLPELPVTPQGAEPNTHTGSYTVQTGWTFVEPDGTRTYRTRRVQIRSGSSFTLSADEHFPDGAELRVSLDSFSELLFRGGNNQYVNVSHYGYYSIGSPSSATVTIPPKPPGE